MGSRQPAYKMWPVLGITCVGILVVVGVLCGVFSQV